MSRARAKKIRKAAHKAKTNSSNPLLRPAKDIISRICHDSDLNEEQFIIGYHDRHVPQILEMKASDVRPPFAVPPVIDLMWNCFVEGLPLLDPLVPS